MYLFQVIKEPFSVYTPYFLDPERKAHVEIYRYPNPSHIHNLIVLILGSNSTTLSFCRARKRQE